MGFRRLLLALAGLTVAPSAHAFCGHYVGGIDDSLGNASSQIVMVRNGNETVLTMANDFEGAPSEFAMLVPVPASVGEADVSVIDEAVIDRLDVYSNPRVVEYSCSDLHNPVPDSRAIGCNEEYALQTRQDAAEPPGVVVTDRFTVGAYSMTIVEATNVGDLEDWLEDRGFVLTEEATPVLGAYIDGGLRFLAAEVLLGAEEGDDGSWLSPIQIRYDEASMSLPVELGTLSSTGVQDLVVFLIDEGEAGISNYDEGVLEQACMTEDAQAAYDQALSIVGEDSDRAVWVREFSWPTSSCDPCPQDGPLDTDDLRALGWDGDEYAAHLSRLHVRYSPDQIDADLALYSSDLSPMEQTRYIEYKWELESTWPICFEGTPDEPGTCDADAPEVSADQGRSGCGVGPGSASVVLLLLGLGLVRRRALA